MLINSTRHFAISLSRHRRLLLVFLVAMVVSWKMEQVHTMMVMGMAVLLMYAMLQQFLQIFHVSFRLTLFEVVFLSVWGN